MAHRTARLNVFGRQLLVTRVELDGWSVAKAAEAQGVSRQTAHKWVTRYRAEDWPGLEDRSSRPHHSPRITPPETVEAILRARVERRWGPHRIGPLLGIPPPSTVHAVLARAGYSRLRDANRLSGVPVRYVHDHPGSLVHQDHKKLGRIPAGGGHRALGRETAPHSHRAGLGYDHFEVVVDDATRLAYVAHVENESASSASHAPLDAAIWFAERGVRIERVLTDNAWAYTSPIYERAVASIDARHKRTRPHRPQTSGKAERFIKTLPSRVGLRPPLSVERGAPGRPARVGGRLQRRADPHRPGRHHPTGRTGEQPAWESHLGRHRARWRGSQDRQ